MCLCWWRVFWGSPHAIWSRRSWSWNCFWWRKWRRRLRQSCQIWPALQNHVACDRRFNIYSSISCSFWNCFQFYILPNFTFVSMLLTFCVHIKVGMLNEPKKLVFFGTEAAYSRTSLVTAMAAMAPWQGRLVKILKLSNDVPEVCLWTFVHSICICNGIFCCNNRTTRVCSCTNVNERITEKRRKYSSRLKPNYSQKPKNVKLCRRRLKKSCLKSRRRFVSNILNGFLHIEML